jgi:putative FmdB family regulatory protein
MPIYEYQCQSCQHQLEALQKINDDPRRDCPACGRADLKKKVSAAAFRLKGGGWYETDFKTGDKKNIAGDKKSSDSDKAASASTSSASSSNSSASSSTKPSAAG